MTPLAKLLVAAVAVATIAVATNSASASPVTPANPGGDGMATNKQKLYAQLRALPMLTEDQRLAMMLIAKGESNFSPSAWNRTASEVSASATAYQRLLEQGRLDPACAWTRDRLAVGSVGRFQRLGPYFTNDLRDLKPCAAPTIEGLDGVHDLVSALVTAHAVTNNYPDRWNRRVSGLRGAWGTLSWIEGDAPDATLAKWVGHARDENLAGPNTTVSQAQAFLQRELTPFPRVTPAMMAAIRSVA